MISIIIPTYQEEEYIGATLKNLSGLGNDYEIIVSDSRSSDGTVRISQQYADKVVVLPAGRKRGLGQGRNDGAKAAKGEYLVFIDADVTVPDPKNFFPRALREFENNPRLVAITGKIRVEPSAELLSDKIIFMGLDYYFGFLNNVFNVGMAPGEFQMMKTEVFREVGGFNETLGGGEDVDLFHRVAGKGRVKTVWELTVYHTGRRFHKMGWANTLYHWIKNAVWVWLFKRSSDKEWETVR